VIGEQRQLKDPGEINYIKYACYINSLAISDAIKSLKPGMYEYQVQGILAKRWISHLCPGESFPPIVCSGEKCSILHCGDSSKQINDGELVLIDVGCEYQCYASDNTRTVPANGKFSEDQKKVYQAVLNANKAVIEQAKPGVKWTDMALLSARVMAQGLIEAGLFINATAQEIIDQDILAAFYMHGLGHGMGLDDHEIAGWPKGVERPKISHLSPLRFGRVLSPGVVITVETGCYFIPLLYELLLNDPVKSKYIDKEVCLRFRKNVGGIRIEDDILITETGNELLAFIPKEISEIEQIMSQQ
jgi:Xaa-Pro dipeptidase